MIRIAITGPESSGKTALAIALGERLSAPVYLEFAREFIDGLNRGYTQEDLETIALGHLAQFSDSTKEIQIIDTDFIVLKVWSKVRFGSVSATILEHIQSNYFDLHILCTPDIPWEADVQREHPNLREELYEMYLEELKTSKKSFITVSGSLEDRIKKSIEAISLIQN